MVGQFALNVNSLRPGLSARPPAFIASYWNHFAPFKMAALTGIDSPFGQAEGHLLFFNHVSNQSKRTESQLIKKTFRAGKKASRLGARIIGFDPSILALLGDSAVAIVRELGPAVTSGSGYAAFAAMEALQKAATQMGIIFEEAAVLILGAAEPLGSVCTQILARDGANHLTLVDSDNARLDLLSRRVLYNCGVACKVSVQVSKAVARADLVVVASRAAGMALRSSDLKPGAIVCNLAAADEFSLNLINRRSDVVTFDEAVVRLPGEAVLGCAPGLPAACICSWMAEAILLALEGRYDRYFLGRELHAEKVAGIGRLAGRHGFALSGFTAAGHYFDFADLENIRANPPVIS